MAAAPNSMTDQPLLEAEGVSVSYGSISAVRMLSLRVSRGESVCLLGSNGAGKSSFFGALAGIVRSTGVIRLDGVDIEGTDPEERVRRGIRLVPEGRRIFASLTVEENLRLAGAKLRPKGRYLERLDAILSRFTLLRERLGDPGGSLSGGQQQQLALARALIHPPTVLLLDEPSLGLDPLAVATVFTLLAELKSEGQTTILAEQNVERALSMADRAYVLSTGQAVLTGPASTLRATDIEAAYLGISTSSPEVSDPPRVTGQE